MSERATRLVIEWAKLREALGKSKPGDKYGSARLQIALEELDETALREVVVTALVGSGAELGRAEELADELERDVRIRLIVSNESAVDHLVLGLRKRREHAPQPASRGGHSIAEAGGHKG